MQNSPNTCNCLGQILKNRGKEKIIHLLGTSLVVHWLRLWVPNAGGLGLFLGQGSRSHMLQPKKKKKRSHMQPK